MAIFTVISVPALIPFLYILFGAETAALEEPAWEWKTNSAIEYGKYHLSVFIEQEGREKVLLFVCLGFVILFFLKNLFRYLSRFFMAPVRNGIARDLRTQVFRKILYLPLSFFSEEKKGDILSRISVDIQEVESSILNVLEVIFREPVIMVGCLLFMISISPSLTLFVFILILFTAFIIGGIGKTLKKTSGKAQSRLGRIVSIVEETIGGLRIIKGFNAEEYQLQKFDRQNNNYRSLLTNLIRRRDLSSPLSEFLGITVVSLLLWYGAKQVFSGQLSADTFFTFLFAFYNVIAPAKNFSNASYNIQKGIAAVERVEMILDADISIQDPVTPVALPVFSKSIEYRNITFAYNEEEGNVLKDVSFSVPKGGIVAFVGASGAGKSTLADLLPRFYDLEKGAIFIDGENIKNFKLKDLRSLMGIVSQDAILFNDTIYNNIAFGNENVTLEQVQKAARIANAHEFILATENGYQTNVGDRGVKLSGGQRQRLTIARAVLRNPPILILDEATSALDSESEKAVQASLLQVMEGRTSVVIAHRLSTIQHADEIIVMKDGEIIERGNHSSLFEKGGEYKKLVALQAFS